MSLCLKHGCSAFYTALINLYISSPDRAAEKMQIMAGDQYGGPVFMVLHQKIQNCLGRLCIQTACGFIGQDNGRLSDHGPSHGHPLLLPPRTGWAAVPCIFYPYLLSEEHA